MFAVRAEFTFGLLGVSADQVHPIVKDTNQPRVPANPQRAAQVFRRHAVVRLVDREVTVATDFALGFLEVREAVDRQREQLGFLVLFKEFSDLLASRSVDACVSDGLFPVQQVFVLLSQAGERATFECVLLNVVHAPFDFALVARRSRFGRQQDRAVMLAETLQLGIEVRIVPVGFDHGRFEVVRNQRFRNAAKMPKGVFQNGNQVVGGLPKDDSL